MNERDAFRIMCVQNYLAGLTSILAHRNLRRDWQEVEEKHPFKVNAIGLLPDHLHYIGDQTIVIIINAGG